jgi:glycosyltransferase involved in cell wall biosynthesis
MRVLHLIKTSQGALWALNFVRALKATDSSIEIFVALPFGGRYEVDYKAVCDGVYEVTYPIGIKCVKEGKRLRSIYNEVQPDIVHSWFTQTTLYARVFLRRERAIRMFEVVGPLHLESKVFSFFDKLSADKKKDYWIATSKYIAEKYKSIGVHESKVFLNYVYIDALKLLIDNKDVDIIDYKAKYNLSEESKIIGTASYFYPPKHKGAVGIKGHELLFDVFDEVLKKENNTYLVICGETFGDDLTYEKRLRDVANDRFGDKVIFTGGYENVKRSIKGLDVFVYLSISENLGGVFESLLFEVPTVSSNVGGLPELVVNGKSGFCHDPYDKGKIAASVNLLLRDETLQESFKADGKQRVLKLFKTETIVMRGMEMYKKVILSRNV